MRFYFLCVVSFIGMFVLSSCQGSSFMSHLRSKIQGQQYYGNQPGNYSNDSSYYEGEGIVSASPDHPVLGEKALSTLSQKEGKGRCLLLDNVPIHPSMQLMPNQSFLFSNHSFKTGYLVYTTPLHIFEMTSFFKKHMTDCGWNVMTQVEHGQSVLSYQNDKQVVVLLIYSKKATFSQGYTNVIVTIGPRTDVSVQTIMQMDNESEEEKVEYGS